MLNRALIFVAQTADTMPTGSSAISVLWIFPAFIAPAMLLACAAEDAQFLISQGLRAAIAASLETLPEFSLKAIIASEAGKDSEKNHQVTANFTASVSLLVAYICPMIFAGPAYFTHELSALASPALFFVFMFPPETEGTPEDIERIRRPILAHSFLKRMLAPAGAMEVSQFVFLLWTRPCRRFAGRSGRAIGHGESIPNGCV